jgi:hypothetical protein
MTNNSTLIQTITPEELSATFRQIVREELSALTPKKETAKYLTRQEVCTLLKISLPTLSTYTHSNIIKGSRIGTRILYLESDILEAVKEIPTLKYKRSIASINKPLK